MDRRGSNTWLVAVLAVAVGFLTALLIFGGDDNKNSSATVSQTTATTAGVATDTAAATTTTQVGAGTSTTTTSAAGTAPASPQATTTSCVDLWNQTNNRSDQVFLVNLMSRQPVRIHVGVTSDVPPQCLITVVANDGTAYVFPEGGGTTYPYAQAPASTPSASLPAGQKTSNALEQRDGTLAAR